MQDLPLTTISDTAIQLRIKAIPGASVTALKRIVAGEAVIAVAAAPERGKANKELTEFIASRLGCASTAVSVVRGGASRHKVVELPVSARGALAVFLGLADPEEFGALSHPDRADGRRSLGDSRRAAGRGPD